MEESDDSVPNCAIAACDAPASFDEFYRREFNSLATELRGSGIDADDALQEAFTKASRDWARVGLYENPAAWVRRV